MLTLVFDVETIEDADYTTRPGFLEALRDSCSAPSNWRDELKIAGEIQRQFDERRTKLALSPRTGRVVAIAHGLLHKDEIEVFAGTDERLVLGDWLERLRELGRCVLAGFNVRHFDIDFVAVRACIHGLELPPWWPHARDYRNVADARDVLDDGKLADWLDRFGLPPKTADGADVAGMSLEEIRAYVRNDVHVERLLLRRLENALPAIRDQRDLEIPR